MKKAFSNSIMKVGILLFVALFSQTAWSSVSEANESTPFYKSWLIERGYTHPGLGQESNVSAEKNISQPETMASTTATNTKSAGFWKSWLQERSYAHPAIKASAATSVPVNNISKMTLSSSEKKSKPKYKNRPEYNVCKFVCLSTCKTCSKSSSSNYLMSRE